MSHAGDALIDLGTYHRPAARRRGAPASRPVRGWRWLPAAAAVLLLAVAPVPAERALTPLWTIPGTESPFGVSIGERSLYVAAEATDGWRLTSYRLADGAFRWAAPLDDPDSLQVWSLGEVPLVTTQPAAGGEATTVGYQPQTGLPRWTHPGEPVGTAGELALLRLRLPPSDLVAVDVATGVVAWTIAAGDAAVLLGWGDHRGAWQRWDRPPHLLTLAGDGRLTRYDAATGEAVAGAGTEAGPGLDGWPVDGAPVEVTDYGDSFVLWSAELADGLVVAPGRTGGIVAYDVDTLTPRWRLPDRAGMPAWCGPVVCLVAEDLSELTGIDRATGAVRWSWECEQHAPPAQRCFLLPTPSGPDGPILVRQQVTGIGVAATMFWQVDPATGERVDLGRWQVMSWPGRDGEGWLLGQPPEPVGRRIPPEPPESMWVAELTVDAVRFEVLGQVRFDMFGPVPAQACGWSGGYLLCWRDRGAPAQVWRVG